VCLPRVRTELSGPDIGESNHNRQLQTLLMSLHGAMMSILMTQAGASSCTSSR
jgi:hypothetical protein